MASNEPPPPPERDRSRSPPPPASLAAAVEAVEEISRRTCHICYRIFENAKALYGHSWVHRERRGQFYSTAPPPPPPPPPPLGISSRPALSAPVTPSTWHPWTIDSKEDRDRTCPKCSKMFNSPKAMYGHLHVHHEKVPRERGEGSSSRRRPATKKARVETTIVVVDPNMEQPKEQETGASRISIDLNLPVVNEEEAEGDESSSSSSSSIDLNKMPSGC